MSKHQKSAKDMAKQLGQGPILPQGSQSASPAPVTKKPKHVSVTIDEIVFFELNPRTIDNPCYEEIKASIKEIGLQSPLTLTKRPGDSAYTLFNGGNTRLKALKELYKETQDDQFYYLDCQFIPFTSDYDLLTLHMVENETRGDMLLVDKARACAKIKSLYEAETGKSLGVRPLADLLSQSGWKISPQLIGTFMFTANHLLEAIPLALKAGMGAPKVNEIRKTYNALKKYLVEKLPQIDSEAMLKTYLSYLNKYDDEMGLSEKYALQDTCIEIGLQVDIEPARARGEIAHIIEHGKVYKETNPNAPYNDTGHLINPDGEENSHTQTKGEEKPDTRETGTEITNKIETGTNDGDNLDANTGNTPPENGTGNHISHETGANQIEALSNEALTKIKMLIINYPVLEHLLIPDEDFPFFHSTDERVANLKILILRKEQEFANIKSLIAITEAAKLMMAYFSSSAEEIDPKEYKNIYEDCCQARDRCRELLKEDKFIEIELELTNYYYGLTRSKELSTKEIHDTRQSFINFAQHLNQINELSN